MGIIKSNYFKHSLIIPICKWQEIGGVSSLKCHGVSTSPTPWHCYVGIIKNTVILKYPLINKRF